MIRALTLVLLAALAFAAFAPKGRAQDDDPISQAEALAGRFETFLSRALPHFNFIEGGVRFSDDANDLCSLVVVARHSHFTSGSFDLGPLAGQVWRWTKANRAQLERAGVCEVRVENTGSFGGASYHVSEKAKEAVARARAEKLTRANAERAILDGEKVLEQLNKQIARIKADIEFNQKTDWKRMAAAGEIFPEEVARAAERLERRRKDLADMIRRRDEMSAGLDRLRQLLKAPK